MAKTLGLDLGTNSIGWAVVDDEKHNILGTGVRIFPMGVNDLGTKKEQSKNFTRRVDRQTRRQYFHKKLRKIKLLELLIKHQMCPLDFDDLKQWKQYDKTKGKSGMRFPSTEEFNAWLKLNPYQLRKEGLERKLTKEEFGRVLYHLIQRRGFFSNRKVKDDAKINKGKDDKGIEGILDAKKNVGKGKDYPTLGAYLFSLSYKEGKPYVLKKNDEGKEIRVRARYTLRQMYKDEFELLWEYQAEYLEFNNITETITKRYVVKNPYKNGDKEQGLKKRLAHRIGYLKNKGIKTELTYESDLKDTKLIVEKKVSLKEMLGGGEVIKQEDSILFYQRPLRIQSHFLDECAFEKTIWKHNDTLFFQRKPPADNAELLYAGKKPCPISHPKAELKRAWEFINNIRYGEGHKLDDGQRQDVLDLINSKDGSFDFSLVVEKLGVHEKFNYEDKHKVPGNYTIKHLKPLFTKEIWEDHYEDIWHCFYSYSDNQQLVEKLEDDFGLKEKGFDKVRGKEQEDGTRKGGIMLKEGYSNLSLKAMENILPFLEEGYDFSFATLLGGVKNMFDRNKDDKWNSFEILNRQNEIVDKIKEISKEDNKEGEAIEKIKSYLKKEFGFSEKQLLGLYHHSQDTEKQELQNELPDPENLRNPLVQQALYVLKGLVKAISKEYLAPEERFAQIKVEMARDLKQSKQRRLDQWYDNLQRQNENDEARKRLDEYGLAHSRNNIHKYLLWKELMDETGKSICPYTGKEINITDLFNDNKFQIEHIVPYSKSLDDSFANKTLCEAEENGKKGERTPYEFYGSDEKKWETIAERAFTLLPYHKAKRFTNKKAHETNYISRQLNDTRYISKEAAKYLKRICSEVQVFPGQLTAELRKKWGMDSILNPPTALNKEDKSGPVYAQIDSNGNPIAVYPVFNKPPKYEKGEFVITGVMQKGKFASKYLTFNFETGLKEDGKYWAKINVGNKPVKLVSYLKPKPVLGNDEILLYGKTNDKGGFVSRYLKEKQKPKGLENDTGYWAHLKVIPDKTKFISLKQKKSKTKNDKNQILLFGKVEDGKFISKPYVCKAEIEDGKYKALLEVELKSITYHKVINEKPEISDKSIRVFGWVKEGAFQPAIARKSFYDADDAEDGRYWVVFEIKSNPYDFTLVQNPQPKEDDQRNKIPKESIIEGNIIEEWVVVRTGEIIPKVFLASKQRSDYRHHAIDALVVAMTERSHLNALSRLHAAKRTKRELKQYDESALKFEIPWNGDFRVQADKQVKQILVSHKKTNRVLTVKKNKDPKTGKVYEGIGATGQLHEKSVYGLRYDNPEKTSKSYRKRVVLKELTPSMIRTIADKNIRNLILDKIKEAGFEIDNKKKPIVNGKASEKKFKEVLSQPFFLKNTRGGEDVPIKKVRLKISMKGVQLSRINQHFILGNNNRILIYKNNEGELKYHSVPFWDAVEKTIQAIRHNEKSVLNELPSEDKNGGQLIESFQEDDMFLLNLKEKEDIREMDINVLSEHLYKVQKIGGNEDYFEICFRHHLDARPDKEAMRDYKYIKGFGDGKTGWQTFNPIKVKITPTGHIEKIK